MKIFTCRICGEVYIGKNIPGSCPFCGVENKYLRLAHIWQDENNVELSEVSIRNLEAALELEMSNTALYKAISKEAEDLEMRLMFKGLYKVELEHAEVFAELLKIDLPEIEKVEIPENRECIIKESETRERRAVKFYEMAMMESVEPRVKEVFEAIMNVEKEHIELDQEKLN